MTEPAARLWGVDAPILTTRGRRTGRERTLVLRYMPDDDAMIVAVRAEELPPVEAAAAWRRIVEIQPSYERFRRATDRTIPILRLLPQLDGSSRPSRGGAGAARHAAARSVSSAP